MFREYARSLIPFTFFRTWWSVLVRTPTFFTYVLVERSPRFSSPLKFYSYCAGLNLAILGLFGILVLEVTWHNAYDEFNPSQKKRFIKVLQLKPYQEEAMLSNPFMWQAEYYFSPGIGYASKSIRDKAGSIKADDVAKWLKDSTDEKDLVDIMCEVYKRESGIYSKLLVPVLLMLSALLMFRLVHAFLGRTSRAPRETVTALLYVNGFWLPILAVFRGLQAQLCAGTPCAQINLILLFSAIVFMYWHNYTVLKLTHMVRFRRWLFAAGTAFLVVNGAMLTAWIGFVALAE